MPLYFQIYKHWISRSHVKHRMLLQRAWLIQQRTDGCTHLLRLLVLTRQSLRWSHRWLWARAWEFGIVTKAHGSLCKCADSPEPSLLVQMPPKSPVHEYCPVTKCLKRACTNVQTHQSPRLAYKMACKSPLEPAHEISLQWRRLIQAWLRCAPLNCTQIPIWAST